MFDLFVIYVNLELLLLHVFTVTYDTVPTRHQHDIIIIVLVLRKTATEYSNVFV